MEMACDRNLEQGSHTVGYEDISYVNRDLHHSMCALRYLNFLKDNKSFTSVAAAKILPKHAKALYRLLLRWHQENTPYDNSFKCIARTEYS